MVAVGETGLDFYRDRSDPEDQRRAFAAQIAIAKRTGKALVIHLRDRDGSEDAVSEAFETLCREADGVDVILHCFSAGPRWAERAAEHGWYCSFAGNLTYPKAEPIREAAAIVPEDRVLVETDSPFLAPQPVRGKPNQPANVVATAERLAEVRGVPYGELEESWRRTPRESSGGEGRAGRRSARRAGSARTSSPTRTCWTRSSARRTSTAEDVVLEVGGGGGALTERLAPAVAACM